MRTGLVSIYSRKDFYRFQPSNQLAFYYLLRFNHLFSLEDQSCFDLQSKRSKISNSSFSPFPRGDFYRFQPSTLSRGPILFRFTVEKIENIQSFFLFFSTKRFLPIPAVYPSSRTGLVSIYSRNDRNILNENGLITKLSDRSVVITLVITLLSSPKTL